MAGLQNKIPTIKGLPFIGSGLTYMKNPLKFYFQMLQQYGDIVRYKLGNLTEYALFNSADIKHVLYDNSENYDKSSSYRYIKTILGDSILTAGQADWEWRRKLAAPAFTNSRMQQYGKDMSQVIESFVGKWNTKYKVNQEFSLYKEMNHLALEIAGVTMFGSSLSEYSEALSMNLSKAIMLLEKRVFKLPLPLWVPVSANRNFLQTKKVLNNIVFAILTEARKSKDAGATIPLLIETFLGQDTLQKKPATWNIVHEAITYLIAGHETTGSALTWAFYLISQNPEVENTLIKELDTILNGRTAQVEDISKLKYTEQVVRETLRLYPSIWIYGRKTIHEDILSGHSIPPGTDIVLVPYVIHRDPRYWKDPERFDPDRFAPGKEIDKYYYIPFAGGPRICIGHKFAVQEMILVLATFLQRFRLRLKPGFKADPEVLVLMRPPSGMPMYISEKKT